MEQLKGAHLLIDALGLLASELRSRLRITVAGDGRERAALERAAARLADTQVTFTGWIDAGQREQLFASLDLLVVPSVWPEPLGLIGLEAASAGVPAVAFDVGGIGDWLEDGVTGRLVPGRPPSSRALAAAITDSLADVDRLRTWGVQARDRARRHTIRAHVDALDAIFRRAAEYHLPCSLQ
jgi:glycosyltransferase involved in cell wall biosynthesis